MIQLKNHKYLIVLLSLVFFPLTETFAHQPDISTTILAENAEGEWILKTTCSASALEYEIKVHNGDNSYQSKEEFEQQVLEHVRKNLSIVVNGDQNLSFFADYFQLGHESQILFKVANMPKDISSIQVTNSSFKDIHQNQNLFMVLKDGSNENHFFINDSNNHSLALKAEGNNWVSVTESSNSVVVWFVYGGIVLALVLFGFLIFKTNPFDKFRIHFQNTLSPK